MNFLIFIFVLLITGASLRAQSDPATARQLHQMPTGQVMDIFRGSDLKQRQLARIELNGRHDAFIPLLKIIAEEKDIPLRNAALFPCCCGAPSFGSSIQPEAQDAVNAAIPVLLKMQTESPLPDMSQQLLLRIAAPEQLLPQIKIWLNEPPGRQANYRGRDNHHAMAMELLRSMPLDAPPEVDDLVAAQADGYYMAEQVMQFLAARMPRTEPILLKMILTDKSAEVRGGAITALAGGRDQHLKFSVKARDTLQQCLTGSDENLAYAACLALVDPKRGASPAAMFDMVGKLKDPKVRPVVARMLIVADPKLTTSPLLPMLQDPSTEVRRVAVTALCRTDYDRFNATPPAEVLSLIDDPDPTISGPVSTFVSYCGYRNTIVGPVTELKTFRFRNRLPTMATASVPAFVIPQSSPTASAASTASSWQLPFLPIILNIVPFLIWPILVLASLGTVAAKFFAIR